MTPEEEAPPTEHCGCVHYLGMQIVTCQGPHTTEVDGVLQWVKHDTP